MKPGEDQGENEQPGYDVVSGLARGVTQVAGATIDIHDDQATAALAALRTTFLPSQ